MPVGDVSIEAKVWMPSFLENSEEELSNHKIQASKALKQLNEQYNLFVSFCEDNLFVKDYNHHPSEYTQCLTLLKKLQRENNTDERRLYKYDEIIKNSEVELTVLREQKDKLQDEILQFSEDNEKLATHEAQLLKQKKEAHESMELMWSSYIQAKNVYKKSLQCHIRLHDPKIRSDDLIPEHGETLTFSFVTGDKTLLKVQLNRDGKTWKMLDAQPLLPAAVELQSTLLKTNNIRSFLCLVRKQVLNLSMSRK